MKKHFLTALLTLILGLGAAQDMSAAPVSPEENPAVKLVVTPKRIWVLADEIPAFNLSIQVKNEAGALVLEKLLNAKTADWSVCVEGLSAGNYTVYVGGVPMTKFTK